LSRNLISFWHPFFGELFNSFSGKAQMVTELAAKISPINHKTIVKYHVPIISFYQWNVVICFKNCNLEWALSTKVQLGSNVIFIALSVNWFLTIPKNYDDYMWCKFLLQVFIYMGTHLSRRLQNKWLQIITYNVIDVIQHSKVINQNIHMKFLWKLLLFSFFPTVISNLN
jgi:hypothetical protein